MKLKLSRRKGAALKILCLGAHSDDIEIGCGGSILKLLEEIEDVHIYWIVFSGGTTRAKEALKSARKFLTNARRKEIMVKRCKDGFFPYTGGPIKDFFEELKKRIPAHVTMSSVTIWETGSYSAKYSEA